MQTFSLSDQSINVSIQYQGDFDEWVEVAALSADRLFLRCDISHRTLSKISPISVCFGEETEENICHAKKWWSAGTNGKTSELILDFGSQKKKFVSELVRIEKFPHSR